MKQNRYIVFFIATLFVLTGCSTTRRLPQDEVLYTGIKKIDTEIPAGEHVSSELSDQVNAAISVAPNNSLFGSPTIRIPFPFGLWMYNLLYTEKERGFRKWLFNRLASDPVLISKVEPKVRSTVAETLMKDYGYFNGKVTYEIIPDKKNPKKAKISYFIDYNRPYKYSKVETISSDIPADSLIKQLSRHSLIKAGDIFNVNMLEAERKRISDSLRYKGYYYYRPDFISYMADSTSGDNQIVLRIVPKNDLPAPMLRPWRMGNTSFALNNISGMPPNDTVYYRGVRIGYRNRLKSRRRVLYNTLAYKPGDLYTPAMEDMTNFNINRLNTFKYTEMRFAPQDTLNTIDSLRIMIDATYDLPYDAELEFNVTTKSNDQTGPGSIFGVTKRNLFKGGEVLNTEFTASYEWMTGQGAKNSNGQNHINSYEFGITSSLTIPRLILPDFVPWDRRYPASTVFKLNGDILNRAGFFKLLNMGGSAGYDFYTSPTKTHSFTAFSLKYSSLMNTTAAFDTVMSQNEALRLSFEDQFIPSIGYTFTYDDSSIKTKRNHMWFQFSVTEAGNILYGLMDLIGNNKGKEKTLMGQKFSQFFKTTAELRYYYMLTGKSMIASRLMGGIVKPYLNSSVVPYNEQFFIGGANSIRAFSVRTIGPGSYHPASDALYSYLDQTGNLKLEANIEYRFPIISSLYGALFVDAGNVWLLEKDTDINGGEITMKSFGKDLALGTGAGLRFDITFLVIRLDVGVPIHKPYSTGKTSYYNVNDFWGSLAYHFAIGYPF